MNVDSTDVISHIYFEVDSDVYNNFNKKNGGNSYDNNIDSEYLNTESMLGGNERRYLDNIFSGGAMDLEEVKKEIEVLRKQLTTFINHNKTNKDINKNIDTTPLEKQLNEITEINDANKQDVENKIKDIKTKMEEHIKTLEKNGSPVVDYISNITKGVLSTASTAVSGLFNTASNTVSGLFDTVGKTASEALKTGETLLGQEQKKQGGGDMSAINTEVAEQELMQIIENARSTYNMNSKKVGGTRSESSVSLSETSSIQNSEISTHGGRVNIVFNVSQKAVKEMKKSIDDVKHTSWMAIVSPIIKQARKNLDLEGDKLTESKEDALHKEVMKIFEKIKGKINKNTSKEDVEKML